MAYPIHAVARPPEPESCRLSSQDAVMSAVAATLSKP